MVACDQPFSEVDQPEFQKLLEYTHMCPSLKIPHHQPIKQCIMKMGEDTVNDVKKMIAVIFAHYLSSGFNSGYCTIGFRL
jgi:hypothetical protein